MYDKTHVSTCRAHADVLQALTTIYIASLICYGTDESIHCLHITIWEIGRAHV